MSEMDVDAQIKNYWQRIEQWSNNDEVLRKLEEERYGGSRTKFHNPEDEHPMQTALYLGFLDTTPLKEAMMPFYRRVGSVQYLESMGLTFVFMKVTGKSPDATANYLKTHPACAELLGYKRGQDGKYRIPDGETIRYNIKERFGHEGIKKIDHAILVAISRRVKELSIDLGDCCSSDAFPIEAVSSDEKAEYNGHYEKSGYKCAMTSSYSEETGIVPLVGKVIGINDDEGKELIPQIQELKGCEVKVKKNWVDGKYATLGNIPQAEIIEGTELYYDIAENWVYNHEATLDEIRRDYQKFHGEPDFRVGATIDFMMEYLVKNGRGEIVGYMLRNEHMAAKEECPDGYLDHFHRRNMSESANDLIKNDKGLQRAVRRKGKEHIELQLQLTLLALHVIALVRLQKGVKKNLVSTRGLT
ncbi:hypothetical protein HY772_09610 [Candidatus Woesearchaeota archaeon]|nr:hypothetical protein [Candidatus Woesearchaeota archaeon]